MGIIARFLAWAWRRWADYNLVVAILDLFDWKTGLFAAIGGIAAGVIASTNMGWSPQAVILAALVGAACISLIAIALRLIFWPGHRVYPGETTTYPDSILIPDWTFKEFLFHICPNLFTDGGNQTLRTEVADLVKNKLAAGAVKSWGRKIEGSQRLSLDDIPKTFWPHASFTYDFLGQGTWGARSPDGVVFEDLQVNRAQSLAMFFIALKEGAGVAYEATEGTLYGNLNDRLSKSATQRTDHHISAFLNRKMVMLGQSPPSTKLRHIPDDDKPLLKWVESSNSLKSRYAAQPGRYDNVLVRRADLQEYCEYLRRIGGASC